MKFRKVNVNKIVMLSRQSEKPSMDFLMLKDEILKQNPNAEVVMLNKMLHKNVKSIIGFYLHMYKNCCTFAARKKNELVKICYQLIC